MRRLVAKSAELPGARAERAAGPPTAVRAAGRCRRGACMLGVTMARSLGTRLPGLVLLALLFAVLPSSAVAQSADVTISTDYPSIVVQGGKQVKFPVRFTNNGTVDREMDVTISGPESWKPQLKNQSFLVRRVYLQAGKNLTVDFTLDPPASATAGDYAFSISGVEPRGGEVKLDLSVL